MITAPERRRPVLGLLTAGLLGAGALAGCGSDVDGSAAPSPSSGAASSATSEASSGASSAPAGGSTGALDDVADLSSGLLPAEVFGAGAQVTPVSADQIEQQQSPLGGLALQDLTITPESCAPAVKSIQPGLADLKALGAQTVTVGSGATVEVLAVGTGITDGVDQLTTTARTCPRAQISAPQIGRAEVTFAELDVPDLGDGTAGLTMTVTLTGPDGQPITVPVLLGMAKDGDRLVSLTTTDPTGKNDPAAFAALLQQAYDHQADVLG